MALTETLTTSFKQGLLEGLHNFRLSGGSDIKMALYLSSATLDATTTAYTASGEASGTGYTAGGQSLTRVDPTTAGTTAFTDFADLTWSASTITARGALMYDADASNASVGVVDFGSDKSSSGSDFTVVFPVADANNAIIRIA